jgi:predicted ATPase/class 3 adenylate cyclase
VTLVRIAWFTKGSRSDWEGRVAELPSGTVTFVFTDLEVSTRLWDQEPDAMSAALARHDEILREGVVAHGGHLVKGRGDGVHAVFATADAAVRAAIDCELAMGAERWAVSEPLRARIGIHTGVAELRDGDYFGSAVNRAARLEAIAHGGQIVCSQATAELARDVSAEGVVFVDLGEHRLRDLSRAERVFQVHAPGLESGFAPLTSVDSFPGNLPLQVSSFIGRKREIERTVEALTDARVVTLTGVGGVGKTRLACQVAAQVLPGFREGAWLVELAPVRDPDGVVDAFAAVFGITARAGQGLEQVLVEFLRTKQLLMVIDNCEHILGAVAELVETLERSCPGLVVLATSREGLGVDGEQMFVVPSLGAPARGSDLDAIAAADSVQLFAERAAAAKADFLLTEQNAESVVRVCRRLDGVPLAIELAAARVPAMSPSVLASRLDQRFRVLTGGKRGAVERHQTLRAAIDWSYELCAEPEQRLLARLTVFAGGCTLDGVEAVCTGDGIESDDVFGLLANLVARSLVVADDTETGDLRYRLLETIRQYGEERLAEREETDALRRRHAEYFCEFAGEEAHAMVGPAQVEAGQRFGAEHDNIRTALRHAVDSDDADLALRIVYNLPTLGSQIGKILAFPVDDVIELADASEHPLYPIALAHGAVYAGFGSHDPAAIAAWHDAALDAARRLGDPDRRVEELVTNSLVYLPLIIGAYVDAARLLEQSGAIARSAGRLGVAAYHTGSAAFEYGLAGDTEAAKRIALDGLPLARESGMPSAIVSSFHALALALCDEDRDRAQEVFDEAVQLRAGFGYESVDANQQAAILSVLLERWPETLRFAAVGIPLYHWIKDLLQLNTLFNLVARAVVATDPEAAAVLQGMAYQFATSLRDMSPWAPAERAARTPGEDTRADVIAQIRHATTELLTEALGESRLQELRIQGRGMDFDHAVAYAIDTIDAVQRQAATQRA